MDPLFCPDFFQETKASQGFGPLPRQNGSSMKARERSSNRGHVDGSQDG